MRDVLDQSPIIAIIVLLLTFLQPAYANGGHVHLGGIFFLLLGGVVFIGGFALVLYFLFRANPAADDDEESQDDDRHA